MGARSVRDVTRLLVCAALALPAAVATLAGCGEESSGDAIIDVTRQLAADGVAEDWKGVCDALSARARAEFAAVGAELGGTDCADAIARVAAGDDSPEILVADGKDVKVSNIEITGDRATADVRPSFNPDDPTVHYVREDGAWKLDR